MSNTDPQKTSDASIAANDRVGSSDSSATGLFEVGETLKCLQYVERTDRCSSIKPGDIVKVTQAFAFTCEGKQCQDITVQRGRAMLEPQRMNPDAPKRLAL